MDITFILMLLNPRNQSQIYEVKCHICVIYPVKFNKKFPNYCRLVAINSSKNHQMVYDSFLDWYNEKDILFRVEF